MLFLSGNNSLLGGYFDGIIGIEAEILIDLHFYTIDIGRRQINFINDGNYGQIVFHGEV